MLLKKLTGAVALTALLASASVASAEDKIALIMSSLGSANPFWGAVEQGAKDKGKELGIEVVTVGPPGGETDVAGQIALVEDQIARGVTGIAISPADTAALVPVLEQARQRGIAVVFVDKRADMPGTYIGTNNVPAAKVGAKHVCDNVPEGSDVAIIQGIITGSTGQHRAQGANEGLSACGLNIVAEQPADWDTAKALSVTENILAGNPNLKAIFASNDNMALGVVEAARNAGKLDDLFIVGFDGNPNAAEAILAGDLDASVAQRPYTMGQMGVELTLELSKGGSLDPEYDTGAILVTTENAEEFK
ncbi:sugar ABC transporter substrate-binding protein [Hoeflea prorocentri]|uniref:Sugar ABC transporter substrate-binding protein n=1 Tax=Hoeflea prorocentri TaxID=1922333 RepID=A0A9X3UIC2_9HYPH|nr:sugar ABC transporter substrate-binding protein [Hoeflea prorocentri]MCY6379744.1 sugar ABC transporter substrate-binding protein [Hoeflea prorocentri]MDA5397544.1 sugar ABC transporter substrate-binding protein [Hoeflea prorocentri]